MRIDRGINPYTLIVGVDGVIRPLSANKRYKTTAMIEDALKAHHADLTAAFCFDCAATAIIAFIIFSTVF
jgi:hypothetical protein